MIGSGFRIKRRVWIGLVTGIAGVGMWTLWNQRFALPPSGDHKPGRAFVQLAGAGAAQQEQLLRERAELFDPTPLFFPTEWNYGQQPVQENLRRQPGQVFGSFDAKQVVPEQNIGSFGVESVPAPEKLSDVLVQGNESPFAGMGQVDLKRSTLPVRDGYLEVYALNRSKEPIHQMLSGLSAPRSDFAPVEFLVMVEDSGLVGEPVLVSGSGWDEVDAYFRTFLVKAYQLGGRLPPGRYRVVVGA